LNYLRETKRDFNNRRKIIEILYVIKRLKINRIIKREKKNPLYLYNIPCKI